MTTTMESGATDPGQRAQSGTAPVLRPTLFIGIGGTGMEVLGRFRRRIAERHETPDFFPFYAFLGIDSDVAYLSQEKRSPDFRPLRAADCFPIGLQPSDARKILDNMQHEYRHLSLFLPDGLDELDNYNFTDGARQVRAVGRLLFVNKIDQIRQQIYDRIRVIRSKATIDQAVRDGIARLDVQQRDGQGNLKMPEADVVIVASIAGGTGAGGLLDCAYLIKDMQQNGEIDVGHVRAFIVLPDVFEKEIDPAKNPEQVESTYANGFALLSELEYFNQTRSFDRAPWGPGKHGNVEGAPFTTCYLFSSSNGAASLSRARETYELIADALTFTLEKSTLADHVRTSWSNSQNAYTQPWMGKELWATSARDGAELPGSPVVPNRYRKYFVPLTRRYSALGVAKVTMKLPELRRLAALHWLRRLIDAEAGQRVPQGYDVARQAERELAQHWNKSTAEVADLHEARPADVFLGDGRRILHDSFAEAVKAAASAPEVQAGWESTKRQLDGMVHLIKLGDPSHPGARDIGEKLRTWAYKRFAFTDEAAEKKAVQIEAAAREVPSLHLASALLDAIIGLVGGKQAKSPASGAAGGSSAPGGREGGKLQAMKDKARRILETRDKNAELARIPRVLANLEDTDRSVGFYDVLQLRISAREVLRDVFVKIGRTQIDLAADAMETMLDARFLERLDGQLQAAKRRLDEDIQRLARAAQRLAELQSEMADGFEDTRNIVLTRDRAARPGAAKEEDLLDREVERALAQVTTQPDVHAWGKQQVLQRYQSRSRSASVHRRLLDALPKGAQRESLNELLNDLVELASEHVLQNLPHEQDVFKELDDTNQDLRQALASVVRSAQAYWPTVEGQIHPVQQTRAFGAVKNDLSDAFAASNAYLRGEVNWDDKMIPDQSGDAPFVRGELTLVQDAHGYTLPTLKVLRIMSNHYVENTRKGYRRRRHIDQALVGRLPRLLPLSDADAERVVHSLDIALVAITRGLAVWDTKLRSFRYQAPGEAPIDLGEGFEQVAAFMRDNPAGPKVMQDLEYAGSDELEELLRTAINSGDPAVARSSLDHLCRLNLAYGLLREKVFARQDATAGREPFPPNYTRMRRLQFDVIGHRQALVEQVESLQSLSLPEVEAELRQTLHEYVAFVGPAPDPRAPYRPDTPAASLRLLRVFREPNKRPGHTGLPVLQEASKPPMLWFGDRYRLQPPPTLFPNDEVTE